MPCMSYTPEEQASEAYAKLDRYAQMLCRAMRALEELEQLHHPRVTKRMRSWWKDHKIKDAQRIKEEAMARRAKQAKREALAKLTPEERAALGLE